jgi:ABC-2 type transport system ATP-binding protein
MQHRLALATALFGDPAVLVLDEPANGLDREGIRSLRDFLRAVAAEGRTVLISSHLLAEVAQTVDHVVVINHGQLIHDGSVQKLVQRGVVACSCACGARALTSSPPS